jgi:hypothetical protein
MESATGGSNVSFARTGIEIRRKSVERNNRRQEGMEQTREWVSGDP